MDMHFQWIQWQYESDSTGYELQNLFSIENSKFKIVNESKCSNSWTLTCLNCCGVKQCLKLTELLTFNVTALTVTKSSIQRNMKDE